MTGYECKQAMRRLETEVRKQRDIKTAARASGSNKLVRKCNEKIRLYTDKYNQIADASGITPQPGRMGVVKVGSVDNFSRSGIIKENAKTNIATITDEAIDRVPKIHLKGFSEAQNVYIQREHKALLKYAKDNNNNKEVAFVFRKGLTDKSIFVGSDDVVDFGNGLFGKGNGLFVMHNHPRNSGFSSTDIATFISSQNIQHISIVKNNGEIEIISKTDSYSQERVFTEFKRQYKKYVKTGTDAEIDKAVYKFIEKSKEDILWNKSK